MRTKLRDRVIVCARELGWLFSGFQPDQDRVAPIADDQYAGLMSERFRTAVWQRNELLARKSGRSLSGRQRFGLGTPANDVDS
jgi:hypothetical protein